MKNTLAFVYAAILLLSVSCARSVKPEQLYGKWKYIKVENPNQHPPYVMPDTEVKAENPSIQFSKSNDLVIMWGGKRLSYGTFRMEDNMIRYKEVLEDGATREFPFLIKEISESKLVFETMQQDATRITAERIR